MRLSLIHISIGKEGQNARLAAKLTGYKIDIKPVSAADSEEEFDEDNLIADEDEDLIQDEAPEAETETPAEEETPAETEAAPEDQEGSEDQAAVSYTHLDVYKRQPLTPPGWILP